MLRHRHVLFAVVLIGLCLVAGNVTAAPSAVVDVTLFPAGDFKGTTSKVQGYARKNGDEIVAENVKVDLRTLTTGIKLRDNHTQRYLNTKQNPFATLIRARGKGGKGDGEIEINGVRKKINGTYQINGSDLTAKFPIKFSDFKIENIKYMGVGVEDQGQITVIIPVRTGKK